MQRQGSSGSVVNTASSITEPTLTHISQPQMAEFQ
jgi:hypothetical protein